MFTTQALLLTGFPAFAGTMAGRSDEYRKKQKECVEQAEKARSSSDRAKWLHIAEEWKVLADQSDESPMQHSKERRG
jgi:hypothetical protein